MSFASFGQRIRQPAFAASWISDPSMMPEDDGRILQLSRRYLMVQVLR